MAVFLMDILHRRDSSDRVAALMMRERLSTLQVNRMFLWSALFLLYASVVGAASDIEVISARDFLIQGAQRDDRLGQRVAIGDINGDFLDDLIICARFFDPPGRLRAGGVFVVFGRNTPELGGSLFLDRQSADLTILGRSAEDWLGLSYESPLGSVAVGDLNGDLMGDLIVAAPRASPLGRNQAGAVYVFWGRQVWPSVLDLSAIAADVEIAGVTEMAHLGSAVAVGDLDGDGLGELVLGSPLFRRGSIYPYGRIDVISGARLFAGRIPGRVWDLAVESADWVILGASEMEQLGDNFVLGDANGDGLDDLLLGVSGAHVVRFDSRGKAYLLLGRADRLNGSTTDLAIQSPDCTILGRAAGDRLGAAVRFAQLRAGSPQDLVISAPNAILESGDPEEDRTRFDWGVVYLIRGREVFPQTLDLAVRSADVTIYGATNGDRFGYQLATGRITSRRVEDLVVGSFAIERTAMLREEGLVVVFPTERMRYFSGQVISLLSSGSEIRLWGGRSGEALSTSLVTGDVNGDGFDDLLIGAPLSRSLGGRAYLFYGEGLGLSGLSAASWDFYR